MTALAHSRLLAAVAAAAILAGCSGASQVTPSSLSQPADRTARTASTGSRALAGPFRDPRANALFASRSLEPAPPGGGFSRTSKTHTTGDSLLFVSATMIGAVYAYDIEQQQQVWGCNHCGGYGLATDPTSGDVAIATYLDYYYPVVQVYHVNDDSLTLYSTLYLSGSDADYGLGVAYDAKGNLYATVSPTNAVNEFYHATITKGGGNPDRSFTVSQLASADYLTTDGTKVIVNGTTSSSEFVALLLDTSGKGADKLLNSFGSESNQTGFPGGMAVDSKHNLIVNNQYGTLTTYAKPWTGSATSTLNWDPADNDYTGIALNPQQTEVYADDFNSTYDGIGISNPYPLSSVGSLATYPMAEIFLGVTLTRVK
jgi:hypothetical protein